MRREGMKKNEKATIIKPMKKAVTPSVDVKSRAKI
jgi:hypothetical protein